MIDLKHETLLTFNQAAKLLPSGSRPSASTWWRWSQRGVKGQRLETVCIGGRRYTTREALARFTDALSNGSAGTGGMRSPTRRQRDLRRASAELAKEGI